MESTKETVGRANAQSLMHHAVLLHSDIAETSLNHSPQPNDGSDGIQNRYPVTAPIMDLEAIDTPALTNSGATTPPDMQSRTGSLQSFASNGYTASESNHATMRISRNDTFESAPGPAAKLKIDRLPMRRSPYPSPSNCVSCIACGKSFKGARSLQRHRETAKRCGGSTNKLFECTCGYARARKDQVKQHVDGHRVKTTEVLHQMKEDG